MNMKQAAGIILQDIGISEFFYAADHGISGGAVRGLSLRGLVAWTGQTRIEYVIVGKDADGMPITRQVYAKQWMIVNDRGLLDLLKS